MRAFAPLVVGLVLCLAPWGRASTVAEDVAAGEKVWKAVTAGAGHGRDELDVGSFARFLRELGPFNARQSSEGHLRTHSDMFIREVDKDGDGKVSRDEFLAKVASPGFRSGPVLPLDPPQQIHLSVTNDPTEMVVMWVTFRQRNGASVQWRAAGADESWQTAPAAVTTYRNGSWIGWNGFIYTATMTGLEPGGRYEYLVGEDQGGWSEHHAFSAKPRDGSVSSTSFLTWGDMGTFVPLGFLVTAQALHDLQSRPADFVFHQGDISYATLHASLPPFVKSSDELEPVWDVWARQVQPLAARMPYMVGVGNHESPFDFAAFRHRFRMPGPSSGGNGNFWFSFDHGLVHIASWSTEHPYAPGTPQYRWLEADLKRAASRRDVVPWIIAAGHRPVYCSDTSEWDDHRPGSPMQEALGPLFARYGVSLVLTGHMHAYERTHPVLNGSVVAQPRPSATDSGADVYDAPKTPAYLVIGSAGALIEESWVDPKPTWSASRHTVYGYGRVTAHNASALQFEFLPTAEGGRAADEMWVLQ